MERPTHGIPGDAGDTNSTGIPNKFIPFRSSRRDGWSGDAGDTNSTDIPRQVHILSVVRDKEPYPGTSAEHRKPINQITECDVANFVIAGQAAGLNRYQDIATKNATYPGKGTALGLIYVALKHAGEAGELAEHIGKAMRDDGFGTLPVNLTHARREAIIKELGDNLWYLTAACDELDIKLLDVVLANLRKLADREKRGALSGSGDNR